MRKPRSDSKLQPHAAQLREWLGVEAIGYDEAIGRMREKFGVKTSRAALSEFYTTDVVPWKYARAHGVAGEFAKLADGKFDEATRKRIQQLAFEIAASPHPDVEALSALCKILGDTARLNLKQREFALNLDKFRQQVKSDIEKGLDALHAEIKGNAEALQLFEKFKAAVLRSAEGKA